MGHCSVCGVLLCRVGVQASLGWGVSLGDGSRVWALKVFHLIVMQTEIKVVLPLVRQFVYSSSLEKIEHRFTCGERKICSTIKKSQTTMNMTAELKVAEGLQKQSFSGGRYSRGIFRTLPLVLMLNETW